MSLTDVLNELNIPYREPGQHHHATQGWVQVDCPWCGPESGRFRMGLANEGKVAHCWACGTHPFIRTVLEITGKKYSYIKELLDTFGSNRIPQEDYLSSRLVLPSHLGDLQEPHRGYL